MNQVAISRVLDESAVERIFSLDRPNEVRGSFLKELLENFCELAPTVIKEIHTARLDNDCQRLQHLAHKLRGISRNIAVTGLALNCQHMEECARQQIMPASECFEQLDSQYEEGYRALVQLVDAAPKTKRPVDKCKTLYRVLIVDDSTLNQVVAGRLLEKLNFTFDVVTNGMDALDAVRRRGPYVAVLMDYQMPAMNGFEATKGIRTFASLPIIAMTASHSDESRAACLAAGMSDFLTKPIALRDLKRVLPRRGKMD